MGRTWWRSILRQRFYQSRSIGRVRSAMGCQVAREGGAVQTLPGPGGVCYRSRGAPFSHCVRLWHLEAVTEGTPRRGQEQLRSATRKNREVSNEAVDLYVVKSSTVPIIILLQGRFYCICVCKLAPNMVPRLNVPCEIFAGI